MPTASHRPIQDASPVDFKRTTTHPWHSLPWPDVLASTVILVVLTMAVLYFHRANYLVMGWFLFVTTLIPVIEIGQVGRQAMADRYAYIPCIGLFTIIAWGLGTMVHAAAIPRAAAISSPGPVTPQWT